jgi:hypothetical protein
MRATYLGSREHLWGVKRVDEVKRGVELSAYPFAGIFRLVKRLGGSVK